MAIFTTGVIIRSISFFHIALAFFFLASPSTISNLTFVQTIGDAMQMPFDRTFDRQSGPSAFLGAVFALWGVSDLASMSMPEEISMYFWAAQAPVRLMVFFAYTFYSFALSPSSPMNRPESYIPSSWGGEGLKNRVFFTWTFLEMIGWFWVYATVREERRELALRIQMRRANDEGRL